MKISLKSRQTAVTLTELLVVLVVISILSTIALPVYINQAERARVATAQQETFELAQAMQTCAIEHGLFVPLQVLDDLPGVSGSSQSGRADAIANETSAKTIAYDVPLTQLSSFLANNTIDINSTDPRTNRLANNWRGPFITFQRFFVPETLLPNQANYADFPLDPWGNPYRFYSPRGLIGTGSSISTTAQYTIGEFDGTITNTDPRFDRWAIVSWGPDGESDQLNGYVNQDDVVYLFGTVKAETTSLNSLPIP